MASVKSKKRREEEKKRAAKKAQEQQRRVGQSKPSMTPAEITNGFSADMLAIMQHFQGARMHVKQRIAQATAMKEGNPERFNELRVDAFTELRDKMDGMQKSIDDLAGLVGTLADLQTMHDKMIFVSQNYGSLAELQIMLDSTMRELQDIDATFNRSVVEMLAPSQAEGTPEMDIVPDQIHEPNVQFFGDRDTTVDTDDVIGFIGRSFYVDGPTAGTVGDTSVAFEYAGKEYVSAANFDKVSRLHIVSEGQDMDHAGDPTKRWIILKVKDAISIGIFAPKENRTAEVDMPVTEADAQAIIADQHPEASPVNAAQ